MSTLIALTRLAEGYSRTREIEYQPLQSNNLGGELLSLVPGLSSVSLSTCLSQILSRFPGPLGAHLMMLASPRLSSKLLIIELPDQIVELFAAYGRYFLISFLICVRD